MKRPPGLWILLSAGVVWLSLQDVHAARATSLIFAKTTTTTTTTDATSSESSPADETATEVVTENSNVTKPTLTGNPQIDYIWDPNLPKELNGYNLSAYPFYERVPDEEIDFKCDGLHDGFYASVPHKCQVYHHCLFGTRYDFLCANYTAFDQKTFICQFVSVVDCVNSKKYWHRNDALYQAASTTTAKPVIVRTAPPVDYAPEGAAAPSPHHNRRPMEGGRRPYKRRRPQYDYYDESEDDYDDYYVPRRRIRPRPRPRPVYERDYADEEYEDEVYERRNPGRRNEERRKPYNRRGEDDGRLDRRRSNKDRRKHEDDDKHEDEEVYEEDRKRPSTERRYHKRRPIDDEEFDRPRSRPKGRPVEDDYEEVEEVSKRNKSPAPLPDDKPIIKPSSGSSLYDRPRVAPRIKPPVPKNEANKYTYKSTTAKTPAADLEDEEYYDDYEEVVPKNNRKSEATEPRRHTVRREETRDTRKQMSSVSKVRSQPARDDIYEAEEEEAPRRPFKPKFQRDRPRANPVKKIPPVEDDYEEYEDVSKEPPRKEKSNSTTTTTTTPRTTKTKTTTTTKPTTTTPKEMPKADTFVRIVKRPFLPSRGGNPYSSRGLQPVGAKAIDQNPEKEEISGDDEEVLESKPIFRPSPVIKMPSRQKYATTQDGESSEDFKPVANRPQVPQRQAYKPNKEYSGPRTTQKPKLPEQDPLDSLVEDEYDVTLNDALNPTLPNLPVRSFPTGFSSANDYYNPAQRPRYVLEGASSDYVFSKPVRRYEAVPNSGSQDQFVNTDADYKGQYSTINRQGYRPRVTQAYYSSF